MVIVTANIETVSDLFHKNSHDPLLINSDLLKFSSIKLPRTKAKMRGGIYEVAVIAIAFDLDPNFVAFHYIIRLLMILFTVPVILKFIKKTNLKY